VTQVAGLLARCRFPPSGTPVTCAWSGGADSTALVVLARAAGCAVSAVHVDHGLRPDSGADAQHVTRLADTLGVPLQVVELHLDDGPNLEDRARTARHRVLPADALLGHTADDQAETVLLQLLRGAGPNGLGAMAEDHRRPLLALRRSETRAVCAARGLDALADPTNADRRFRRNRVRAEVLPLLADIFQRDPVPMLTRAAGHQREVVGLLDQLSDTVDATDSRALRHEHPALARHALRRWLRQETDASHAVGTATVDRVMDVVAHRSRSTELGDGWRVCRTDGRLRVERSQPVEL